MWDSNNKKVNCCWKPILFIATNWVRNFHWIPLWMRNSWGSNRKQGIKINIKRIFNLEFLQLVYLNYYWNNGFYNIWKDALRWHVYTDPQNWFELYWLLYKWAIGSRLQTLLHMKSSWIPSTKNTNVTVKTFKQF